MDLDTLFTHRDDWQRSAFESIKQDLLSARDNRFVHYDSGQEEHLVIVYGNSQVGKTTLLLTMIGIRESACFQEVAETLRAGIPRGNSSTSTAIIYARSEDDRYGFALTTMDNCPPREVSFYDRQGMVQRLKQVREAVEANQLSPDSILYITLPQGYFTDEAAREHIVILDMPGVKSRNHRENAHVESLMTRYLPIASACVIACCSNEIQSLETLELPTGTDWKRMEHRFVLAITRAYSAGSVKTYFTQPRIRRETDFYHYIMGVYTENIQNILGRNNQTEIFPIDLGDSLEMLSQALTDEVDREELLNTRNTVLSNLRKWIAGHRENRLKAALDNLRDVVEHAGEAAVREADQQAEKIQTDIKKAQQSIKRAENQIQFLIGDGSEEDGDASKSGGSTSQKGELLEEVAVLQKAREKLQSFGGVKELYEDLEDELKKKELQKGDDTYWKDGNKKVYAALRMKAVDRAEEGVKALKPEADVSKAIRADELDQQCVALWTQYAPTPQGFFSFKKDRVYIDKLKLICQAMENVINGKLEKATVPYIQRLDKELRDRKQEIENVEQQARDNQARIRRLRRKIKELNKELQICQDEKERLQLRQQQDQKTLDMYKRYARQAHEEQRRQLMTQINSRLPSEDKLILILFLGVLDRDYQKVTGGVYENTD